MNLLQKNIAGICLGQWFLATVLLVSFAFPFWLFAETEKDRAIAVFGEFEGLILEGEIKEAQQFLRQSLASVKGDSMDIAWLPLVRLHLGGYEMLEYFRRILAAEPDRKELYAEISGLIENAPQSFQDQVKQRYLADINAIPGIRPEYLEEYGLVLDDQ